MQKLHEWENTGFDGSRQKHVWECARCKVIARLVSNTKLPPEFRSDIHPCDEMVVRYIMTI